MIDTSAIEESDVFKEYKTAHPKSYLVHFFCMTKQGNKDEQTGYFDPETGKVTTFSKNPVKVLGEDDPMTKQDTVAELNMDAVKLSLEDALAKAQEVMQEHYSAQNVTQEICVLQNLGDQLWNLTLVTNAFNMINIRVDAATGEIVKHDQHSLLTLGKPA